MSRNLVKSYFLTRESSDTKIIDTNKLVAKKLEEVQTVLPANRGDGSGFEQVDLFENAPVADPLDVLSADRDENGDGQNPETEEETGPSREELIAEVQKEIEAMKAQADDEIEAERQKIFSNAKEMGFAEGKKEAQKQCDAMKQELEEEKQRLIANYEEQVDQLEPKFVTTLTDIYEKIFDVDLEDKKPIVVGMLRNTMKKLDSCKNFLIHVSSEDYSYVKEHKDELVTDATREDVVLDIVEDGVMKPSECTIETANGIYDCGLGTQLEGLRKRLWLLAYDGKK